jgi:hypothetical protein
LISAGRRSVERRAADTENAMKVVVNPDGSTTVSCDGSSVTINPPAPAPAPDASAGGASAPGTVSALIAARRRQSPVESEAAPGAGDQEQALVLQGQGEIDVERIRRLLDDAGLERLAIEITPTWRDG